MRRESSLLALVLLVGVALVPPATAATVRGQWGMRPVNGTVVDSARHANLHLSGDWRGVAGSVGRATRFEWNGRPSAAAVRSGRRFNPGSASFAVGVSLKAEAVPATGGYSPNVVQKGLFGDRGQWKLEVVHARSGTVARCRFSGTRGHHTILDRRAKRLNDGRWHEVVCWRTTATYGISVDGVETHLKGTVGAISSSRPLRVAGKSADAGVTDQFQGIVDCVTYVQGGHPLRLARAKVPC
jgi:hypothetical protein